MPLTIRIYKNQAEMMEGWYVDGIHLAPGSDISNDYAIFVTEDMNVAIKHDFMLADCFDEDEDEEEFQANEGAARQLLSELDTILGKEPK